MGTDFSISAHVEVNRHIEVNPKDGFGVCNVMAGTSMRSDGAVQGYFTCNEAVVGSSPTCPAIMPGQ
jgi:hypothetical protein